LEEGGRAVATQYDAFGRPSATGFATSTTLDATTFNPTLTTTLTAMQYGTTAGVELGKPIRTYNYHGTNLESFMQYDNYGRMSSAYSNNAMYSPAGAISATNFSEKITTNYDLADNVLTKVRIHKPNSTTIRTITETTDYDNALRLKRVKHQVDAMAEQIVSQMDYTVKNQLQSKWMGKVGALNFLQKVDYAYNSVGFLTGINVPSPTLGITRALSVCGPPTSVTPSATNIDQTDLFSLELKYENPVAANAPTGVTATPQYGGNISQATWQVLGREKQSYTFKYDHINRLTEARYADINAAGAVTASDRYSELLTYDVRGNIKTLQRYGKNNTTCSWGLIDNLTYQYDPYETTYNPSNKLYKVTDGSDLTRGFKTVSSGSLYSYDVNGNMTADPNKGITNIVYNHLNLPTSITFTGNKIITFLYDAGGNKLRKTVVDNGVTQYTQDYVGGIEYRSNVLESIFHSEGRITNIAGVMKYEYAMKDHLGNTRLMFSDRNGDGLIQTSIATQSTEVTQEQHYYAFGMQMEGPWLNNTSIVDNRYQYNGKELNEDFGLNWNDYGARMYDATLGRWNAIDPLADAYHAYSPYNYVRNNPIRLIDPNGMYDMDQTTSTIGIATPEGIVSGGSRVEKAGIFISYRAKGGKATTVQYTNDGGLIDQSTGKQYIPTEDKQKNKFFGDIKRALDDLRELDARTKTVVEDLITSKWVHTIANYEDKMDGTPLEESGSYTISGEDGPRSSHTKFAHDVDKLRAAGRGMKQSLREDLAHELKHAWNRLQGCSQNSILGESCVTLEEIDCVNFQNIVRVAEKKDPRKTYGDINISNDLTSPSKYILQQKKQ
jgi:RHS repeat-associated protein